MKKCTVFLLLLTLFASLLAGCSDTSAPSETTGENSVSETTDKPDSSVSETTVQPDRTVPTVPGTIYDTGEFRALVPDGWEAFPVADVFSEADAPDPSCFLIIQGGTSDLDVFTKPYVRFDYYGPDTQMLRPTSDWYSDVEDLPPMQIGSHTWYGFTALESDGKMAVLWAEEGNIQYQAIIWLEINGNTISLNDEDVQAILATVEPSDGTVPTGSNVGTESTANYDWWENDWYGWWCIRNGTGIYEPATNIAWDAYAEIKVYNDNTGRVTLWDTGTSRDDPLIYAYDITYQDGASDLGTLVSKRVVFFPTGQWNLGMTADTMDERTVGWDIDPAVSSVSHFSDMLEITGHYESPNNPGDSFDYFIYLRPWGTLWEDVRSGDTSGCIFSDMMPLYHDNWYVSLLNLGYEHPTATFDEGIDIINRVLDGGSTGEPLDPADKADADGLVDMATLKRMLPWCKTETNYSTTYEEIAAMFGVHGKRQESLFENHVFYIWIASEDNYIKIGFDVHEDGSETWNVTQWEGID